MEFIKKNKVLFIVAAVILLFVVSIILTPKEENYLIEDTTITKWLEKIKEDKPTIVTLAQTTCGHCKTFKPRAQNFAKNYDIDYYWFETDLITEQSEYDAISTLFDDFTGTPYTAVLKNGKVIGKVQGGAIEYSSLESQVKSFGIELKERTED